MGRGKENADAGGQEGAAVHMSSLDRVASKFERWAQEWFGSAGSPALAQFFQNC